MGATNDINKNSLEKEVQEENLDFEKAITNLQKIVSELEEGSLSLDQSLTKFVRGVKLIKYCNQELNRAEKKIKMVLKENDEFGEIVDFDVGKETE